MLCFALLFSINLAVSLGSGVVPVLLWGGENVKQVTTRAGHTLSSDGFSDVLKSLTSNPQSDLVVFVQDKLSLDDITQHADVYDANSDGQLYHNLKNLMKKHTSTHIPRVSSPMDGIKSLRDGFKGQIHDLQSPYSVADLPLSEDLPNLVVVHLPDKTGQEESVRLIDKVIGSVSAGIEANGKPYNALYTGQESSKVKRESMYMGRHLLAEDATKDNFINATCIYFYAENITLTVNNGNKTVMPTPTWTSSCTANETLLTLTFGPASPVTGLEMKITFKNETMYGNWKIESWVVSYTTPEPAVTNLALPIPVEEEIYAPMTFSYHCGQSDFKVNTTEITIENLQVQAYAVDEGKFGRPNDCIGFFTIPIWSGIISSIVLITILTFGLMLLASINTMDRFDDPKGKQIAVNVAD